MEIAVDRGAKPVAVSLFERRAGNDDPLAAIKRCLHGTADDVEPRHAVFVGERNAFRHLLDIGCRVQRIAFREFDGKCLGDSLADRRLAAAADPHDDDGMGARVMC
jgi:hypothetical protein